MSNEAAAKVADEVGAAKLSDDRTSYSKGYSNGHRNAAKEIARQIRNLPAPDHGKLVERLERRIHVLGKKGVGLVPRGLLEEAAQALQSTEGRPIESAPKDGRWVIGTGGEDAFPMTWEEKPDDDNYSGWCTAGSGFGGVLYELHNALDENPTHWQPLPTPPQEQST